MASYSIDDLLQIMARLREPERGCPWDLQQTPRTIINYSIEEVYELADAIEQQQTTAVGDELGDLLFQVVFLARLGEEAREFDFAAVVQGLCEKLLRRHPHVFPNGDLAATEPGVDSDTMAASEVARNWEAIKQAERRAKRQAGLFDDVPLALPAMLRARKLQKRAASIGLDWPDEQGALASLKQELFEFEAELAEVETASPASAGAAKRERLAEELGDLLFSCVNVARKLEINPEQALRDANEKFCRRTTSVERSLRQAGHLDDLNPEPVSAEQLDRYWKSAKEQ